MASYFWNLVCTCLKEIFNCSVETNFHIYCTSRSTFPSCRLGFSRTLRSSTTTCRSRCCQRISAPPTSEFRGCFSCNSCSTARACSGDSPCTPQRTPRIRSGRCCRGSSVFARCSVELCLKIRWLFCFVIICFVCLKKVRIFLKRLLHYCTFNKFRTGFFGFQRTARFAAVFLHVFTVALFRTIPLTSPDFTKPVDKNISSVLKMKNLSFFYCITSLKLKFKYIFK